MARFKSTSAPPVVESTVPYVEPTQVVSGTLRSTLSYPVVISYKGEGMRVSPKAVISNVDKNKLGALVGGLVFIPG